jgi:hypothetical protein
MPVVDSNYLSSSETEACYFRCYGIEVMHGLDVKHALAIIRLSWFRGSVRFIVVEISVQ